MVLRAKKNTSLLAMIREKSWQSILKKTISPQKLDQLEKKINREFEKHTIYPAFENTFRAFELTPFHAVKVVILGQDPYHGENQANGLCFSVNPGIDFPPSLRNIFKELEDDLNINPPKHGDLSSWAKQGILLLNTILTVRANQAKSHQNIGWEDLTDEAIRLINQHHKDIVFVLWGKSAEKKEKLINTERHWVIKSAHPSPLSVYRGFWGSTPFSKTNEILKKVDKSPIDWKIS